jgi:hypothetical protein
VADLPALRRALLELHKELLAEQRIKMERVGGRMSASEFLQAAADSLHFDWIRTISELMTQLDTAVADEDPEQAKRIVERLRELILAPDEGTGFGRRYLQALQDHPAIVFAHRDVVAALERP